MPRWVFLVTLVVLAALSRSLPHPQNVTPIGAIALFSGAALGRGMLPLTIPFLCLIAGDALVGFHILMPVVYACFAINVWLGRRMARRAPEGQVERIGLGSLAGTTLAGSIQFFLVTNLANWWAFYPHDGAGLALCYANALPLFGNTLLGDAFFVAVLFGSLAWAEGRFPILRSAPVSGLPEQA